MKTNKADRPRLFIGSSEESSEYAYAIQQNLDDDAEVTVWKQGIFELTKTSVESLIKALDKSDFAVFVFAPNDALRLRQKKYAAVRDNVVFELGLFMGKLGRQRTFIVVPKASEHLRIPTDLTGVALGRFEPNRKDKNLEAALGPFCSTVRVQIRRRGTRGRPITKLESRPKSDLVLIKADYGIQGQRIDVIKQLNAAIKGSKLNIYVGNQLAGDPCLNIPKDLVVRYQYKNHELEKTVPEGTILDLP